MTRSARRARGDRPRQHGQVLVHQQQVRRRLRDGRALPHRAGHVRRGQHRAVVDAVTDHEHAVTVRAQFLAPARILSCGDEPRVRARDAECARPPARPRPLSPLAMMHARGPCARSASMASRRLRRAAACPLGMRGHEAVPLPRYRRSRRRHRGRLPPRDDEVARAEPPALAVDDALDARALDLAHRCARARVGSSCARNAAASGCASRAPARRRWPARARAAVAPVV